ncbi:hypothetical protein N7495_008737 [Penicillium taxi]|uniref:uncharacterized protein n=1 Tax=Penicillium taxi TaxID=168475 RepID=UPI002545B519|nr:uncharacterized protein N7495_008737 [Penicillium taxi]KAJ5888696.1 hypothetical protein N7495_008737 [Penicillium taxi]
MSASPAPSSDGADGAEVTKQSDQIHFKFCRDSNLLYPKEDRQTNTLMFTCRTCHVGEPATSHCVYQNKLNNVVGDTAGVTQDVGSDPTVCVPDFLSLAGFCTLCGEETACAVCGESTFGLAAFFEEEDEYNSTNPSEGCKISDAIEALPRAHKLCPSCGEFEAVFFQSQQRSAETGMKLYYVCCACGTVFM